MEHGCWELNSAPEQEQQTPYLISFAFFEYASPLFFWFVSFCFFVFLEGGIFWKAGSPFAQAVECWGNKCEPTSPDLFSDVGNSTFASEKIKWKCGMGYQSSWEGASAGLWSHRRDKAVPCPRSKRPPVFDSVLHPSMASVQ